MKPHLSNIGPGSGAKSAEARIALYDWRALAGELDTYGCAILPKLLAPKECRAIAALYSGESNFRSHVIMARHGFGKGEYQYFKYPLVTTPARHAKHRFYCGISRAASTASHS